MVELEEHDVRGLVSIAHLFPASRGRCGIYRLTFADGDEYVGQAVNVVRRFADHRRRWSDIVSVGFHRCLEADLDVVERELIQERARGVPVRNVQHVLDSVTAGSDLELVVSRDEQADWLAGAPDDPRWLAWRNSGQGGDQGERGEFGSQRARTAQPGSTDVIR